MAATEYYIESSRVLLTGVEQHLDTCEVAAHCPSVLKVLVAQARGMLQSAHIYIHACRTWDSTMGATLVAAKGVIENTALSSGTPSKTHDVLLSEHAAEVDKVYGELMRRVEKIRDHLNKY